MLKKLLIWILAKVVLKQLKRIEKEDYATQLLKKLWSNKEAREVWPHICEAGQSFFNDIGNEFRDASNFPKLYPND